MIMIIIKMIIKKVTEKILQIEPMAKKIVITIVDIKVITI